MARKSKNEHRLYAAYGSNLSIYAMAKRCPAARPIGSTTLTDYRLVFRSVADVEFHKGANAPLGIWAITEECEKALDVYEGVRSGLYRKEYVKFENGDRALIYVMNRGGILAPHEGYFQTILTGYRDFGLPVEQLEKARRHAIKYRKLNPALVNHHARRATKENANV